ncbi:MAG: glutaminyl-peptide cyclotransferase [Rikenellaceae bacterium]|nr:glutaminyl-peptide cyclotransferase [Rikenellaceae bacterium]
MSARKILRLGSWIAALINLTACGGCGRQIQPDHAMSQYIAGTQSAGRVVELIASVSPTLREEFRQGDVIPIRYFRDRDTTLLDSVVLMVRGKRVGNMEEVWPYATRENEPVGRVVYRVIAYQGADSTVRVGEFAVKAAQEPVNYGYRVIHSYPHDPKAYTQGLYWHEGYLYESTGQTGQSTLRQVDLQSGEVLKSQPLEDKYFGEGAAYLDGKIYQLTWEHGIGFIYDADSFEKLGEFGYAGEGWGLTTDGRYLYMSNGTEKILVIDPETFRTVRTIEVYTHESRVNYLNELEWIEGEIWANIYLTDMIVRIDPQSGVVNGIVDLKRILPPADKDLTTDVLNGIAYDPDTGRIFVTGKNWKKLFEIEVI